MPLWKLIQNVAASYDENQGFIIRARSEKRARELASELAAGERAVTWTDVTLSTCKEISVAGKEEAIMTTFRSG